jgi:hypothetical protein
MLHHQAHNCQQVSGYEPQEGPRLEDHSHAGISFYRIRLDQTRV